MRPLWPIPLLGALLTAGPTLAQDQQARAPAAQPSQPAGTPVYDMVSGDRETAWRINRITGEIVICRVDTTGSLEAARARCSPAALETGPQQSQIPPAQIPPAQIPPGGGRP